MAWAYENLSQWGLQKSQFHRQIATTWFLAPWFPGHGFMPHPYQSRRAPSPITVPDRSNACSSNGFWHNYANTGARNSIQLSNRCARLRETVPSHADSWMDCFQTPLKQLDLLSKKRPYPLLRTLLLTQPRGIVSSQMVAKCNVLKKPFLKSFPYLMNLEQIWGVICPKLNIVDFQGRLSNRTVLPMSRSSQIAE